MHTYIYIYAYIHICIYTYIGQFIFFDPLRSVPVATREINLPAVQPPRVAY